MLFIIAIVLLLCWGGGYRYSPAPYRGNNAWHIVLVVVVILLALEFFASPNFYHHGLFRR